MPIDHPDNWFLKKYDNGEIFGPIHFSQIVAWAKAAQINPQDMVSVDKTVWTKAPMVPELEMDWLIELADNLLYGPTTSETLLEFVRLGEINRSVRIINCCTAETMLLSEAPFFSEEAVQPQVDDLVNIQPAKGGIKLSLQKRIRDLEKALIEKRLQLTTATDTIAKLEAKVLELENRLRDIRTGRR